MVFVVATFFLRDELFFFFLLGGFCYFNMYDECVQVNAMSARTSGDRFLLFQVQAPAPDGRRFKTKVPANCTVGSVFQVPVPPTPAAATPTAAAVATPAARGMTPVTAVPMTQGPISVGSVGTVGALGLRQPR